MKTLSALMESAVENTNGVQYHSRLRVFRNRVFFETGDLLSGQSALWQTAGIHLTDVLPQDFFFYQRSESVSLALNVINDNGTIKIIKDRTTLITPTSSGSPLAAVVGTRPSIWFDPTYGVYVAYVSSAGIYGGYISTANFDAGTYTFSTMSRKTADITNGAVHYTSRTSLHSLYVDEGGVRWRVFGNGFTETSTKRFMFPGEVWSNTDEYMRRLNYSDVVFKYDVEADRGLSFIAYLSAPTGEILAQEFDLWQTYTFGDIFTAIPQDICNFYITNAFFDEALEKVFLGMQFTRREEQDTGVTYNLLSSSGDGRLFSLGRDILVSTLGRRFFSAKTETGLYFSDVGYGCITEAPWATHGEDAETISIPDSVYNNITGDVGNRCTISFSDPTRTYFDNTLIDRGNVVLLDIGVTSGSGGQIEWHNQWETMIIERVTRRVTRQSMKIDMRQFGMYFLETTFYPMYMEMQSRQATLDHAEELSNLYYAPQSSKQPRIFSVDMWVSTNEYEGRGLRAKSHASGASFTYWSEDLKDKYALDDYPVIPTMPFDVEIYGWSRTGLPDTNPNTTDSTASNLANDSFQVKFLVEKSTGANVEYEVPLTSVTSTYKHPPKTWHESGMVAGSYPVTYEVASGLGIETGDKIIKVAVTVEPESGDAPCVFHIERVDIPDITMYVPADMEELWEENDRAAGLTHTLNWLYEDGSVVETGTVLTSGSCFQTRGYPYQFEFHAEDYNTSGSGMACYGFRIETYPGSAIVDGTNGWLQISLEATCIDAPTSGSGTGICVGFDYDHMGQAYCDVFDPTTSLPIVHNQTLSLVVRNSPIASSYIYPGPSGYICLAMYSISPPLCGGTWRFNIQRIEWVIDGGDTVELWNSTVGSSIEEEGMEDTLDRADLRYTQKGVPSILFSETPNYAFDFKLIGHFAVSSNGAWAGLVGHANNGRNYTCARISADKAQIIKVREGIETVLAELAGTYTEVKFMFEHMAGEFLLRIMDLDTNIWGDPILTYSWQEADGAMAVDPDLLHCGVYAYIDTPRFPITSFYREDMEGIPILPGYDLDALDGFPAGGGQVTINGVKYSYTSKTGKDHSMGPYQVCNTGNWDNYYNPSSGLSFDGNAVEIQLFDWKHISIAESVKRYWYNGYLISSDAGYGWLINDIDFRVFITTGGQVVWLKNRARIFGTNVDPSNLVSGADRMYIGPGLLGVNVVEGESTLHGYGAMCYLDIASEVRLISFSGSSGYVDTTIRDLLDTACRWAGTTAIFSGDIVYSTITAEAGTYLEI